MTIPTDKDRERARETVTQWRRDGKEWSEVEAEFAAALADERARVGEEAAIRGVDAVMRHDVQFVNERLRKAIAKDVENAIRRSKEKG